jgi:thiamine-monophosphate kinase
MKETEFVSWLARQLPVTPAVVKGVGDDMAVLKADDATVLMAADMALDGVHFDTREHALERIGRKVLAINLSDCAAMAVRPIAATVSTALPHRYELGDAQRVLNGMLELANQYDVAIVGGDTTSWAQPLAIDVTILAVPYPNHQPVLRSGARPGDVVWVTGPLGGSLTGKHLDFTPRIEEARRLLETLGDRLHAMMDISDGLGLDLSRLCEASGVGTILDEARLERVISPAARHAATQDGRSPLDHALGDGEDFELLFTAAGPVQVPGVEVFEIGLITEAGLLISKRDGPTIPLEPVGYVHGADRSGEGKTKP